MVNSLFGYDRLRLMAYRCKIVLLVTKAVGDFLGTNGIDDEAIRSNG